MRCASACAALMCFSAAAQQPVNPTQLSTAMPGLASTASPIAIVPVDASTSVTGALSISAGKAVIATTGSITSAAKATEVVLPHRGTLRVCAATTVNLAADNSVPSGETPGLMMSLDHGAIETSFATGQNADVVLTPDFRILIGAPGSSDLKVRLGEHGDTCVDNPGTHAPYVVVSSVFDGGAYRVQPGQRVMFQHGSLSEVVDNEKEPCGCPPEPKPGTNDFPLAQSAGIGPQAPPITAPPAASVSKPAEQTTVNQPLVYQAQPAAPEQPAAAPTTDATEQAPAPQPAPAKPSPQKKKGFFHSVGQFFRKIFGAE
ncbi:hypothetical protein [Occallatibacter riparius]|uniref:FecR protein domain-containing protein n=1 Tax=Occallatibacter riparius TaxID=1002689 RepID=A0A9J7BN88_9BACT|nr:hypothetical protein [Occallatibacter riparius]UWZ84171.1 hypothetical protein MOP44_26915 [Occallatibacter riparius]